jgi:hypothetical protein
VTGPALQQREERTSRPRRRRPPIVYTVEVDPVEQDPERAQEVAEKVLAWLRARMR